MCHTCANDLLKHKRSLRTTSPEWDMNRVPEDRCQVSVVIEAQECLPRRNHCVRINGQLWLRDRKKGTSHGVRKNVCSLRGINSILKFEIARRMRRNS